MIRCAKPSYMTRHCGAPQVNIINNFVRFSAQGNLPAATVVVGDVAACNSRINIVDTVLFPMLVRCVAAQLPQSETLLNQCQATLSGAGSISGSC
jgi:hypothetical protein